ncbi:helix-turn-helix domain-containing protein [Pontibacter silvestris]|uniref:Helix-turn-helix domain-containing protein n=1 Tax=Pontibacter silvestris TaxID=2305183 RepID=A0ABW4X4S9_9BACT|nr:helix-turn-helix domain-containing protein [Pontibacter silvestris]MCC9134990.1 helix-turn-helix domain containing protein [Pontibacter silvestris]
MNLLEQQVMDMYDAGHSYREISNLLNISLSKVQRIIQKRKASSIYVDTNDDTPCDDTPDTVIESTLDTLNDTGDSAHKTATDTLSDTANHIKMRQNSSEKGHVSAKRSYSLAEVRIMMMQSTLLKEEIHDYVSEVLDLHSGDTSIKVTTYSFYLRRAKRLIQSAQLLAVQLQEDKENYPAIKLLQEIKSTIQNILSNEKKYLDNDGQVWLDIDEQDTDTWQDYLDADFYQPII